MPAYLQSDILPVSTIAGTLSIEACKKCFKKSLKLAGPPALLLKAVYLGAGRRENNWTAIFHACNTAALHVQCISVNAHF